LVKVRISGLNTPLPLVCKTNILHMEEVWILCSWVIV
jgi:hypothetical protein